MTFNKFLDPKNDIAFRRVFGSEQNKDILIHFINDILNLKGKLGIKKIKLLPTIQEPEIAAKKQSIVDVLCENEAGEKIIVEMQVSPQKGFEERALYYASKAYYRQLNKGQKEDGLYHNLKKVIFIAISNTILFYDEEDYLSEHKILNSKTYKHKLKGMNFIFLELPKFNITDVSKLNTMTEKWCYFFKYAKETNDEELEKIIANNPIIKKAYQEVSKFNWTEKELNSYDREVKRVLDNKAVESYIFDKGLEKGETIGLKKGEYKKAIKMATTMLQDDEAIEKITKYTGLSVDEVLKLRKKTKIKIES
ncbi:MAG: Rpn family recombination-promoting nuclease/putative transposase [Rickettsiaceae bacterium]|nr:Rpn family recombination-promoting nuclease/putative transposase [Rickettsiaceae bacterium]